MKYENTPEQRALRVAMWGTEPEHLGTDYELPGGPYDQWVVRTDTGNMLIYTPLMPADTKGNERVRKAIGDRVYSTLHGVCPKCNTVATPGDTPMYHENWCHSTTDRIDRLIKQAGGRDTVYPPQEEA